MDNDHQASSTDEYVEMAAHIFDYCGGDSSAKLHVDSLMDKFAPFVKTDKSEFVYLKSLLDPDQSNPEISVSRLARALHEYSDGQNSRVELDESFNLRSGPLPQDSDSGISTDGFQLLEELQCELREKSHLNNKLRSQLDFTDRQHEEVVATLTAERDSLRAHLNMLREENATMTHAKRDYEEACDRLSASERALETVRRELECSKGKLRLLNDDIQTLEAEKLTLQELLSKSKSECHRINEMYASRQAVLLEENETLRAGHADLSAKLQDHDEFVQQIVKEKMLLEMELKDILNKSNHTQLRLDRSIDVSYTDDQMLTTLDTLTADTRFEEDTSSVGTQVEVPCKDCVKRNVLPHRSIKRYLWDILKTLFQLFAVACFVCAASVLYSVTRRWRSRCDRAPVPWRWLDAQELMDMLFRIEYVADVPM